MSGPRDPLHAFSIALAVAAELSRRRGVRGVAVTGSLARGDLTAGSDVDLWVLAPRNGREERRVDGVDVSLLYTTPARARSLEGLLRFEVDDAVVLHDPEGLLATLQRTSRARREELRAHMLAASARVMRALADDVLRARPPLAVAALRELVRRGASLAVYDRRGWRVPRLRHFRAELPTDVARDVVRSLALPSRPSWRAKLPAARRGAAPVPALPLPDDTLVDRYLAHGRAGDAVLAVRQGLPPSPGGTAAMTRAQAALFRAVHGFEQRTPSAEEASRLSEEVLTLLDRLRVLPLLEEPDRTALCGALSRRVRTARARKVRGGATTGADRR